MKATDEQVEQIRDHLLGTCETLHRMLETLGLDEALFEDVEERLGEWVEECQGCGWWFEIWELAGFHNGPDGFCQDCRGDEEE